MKGFENLRSTKNPHARIKIKKGHFATSNSHLNTYIDMSTVKTRHNNAREAAGELASEYAANTYIDTIVCLDGTEVIGTFMAEHLADASQYALSAGNNISIITPEYDGIGQIIFRDNNRRMIENMQVLILIDSITTGKTLHRAIETVIYYGGVVCGVCAIFSAISRVAGMEVKRIFESKDLPDYRAFPPGSCPMCKEGRRVEAIVNRYGYSKLESR